MTKYPLDLGYQLSIVKRKAFIKKSRPRKQPQKVVATVLVDVNSILPTANLQAESEVDKLDRINFGEKIMSIIESSSKIYKPKTYKKMVFNLIYFK